MGNLCSWAGSTEGGGGDEKPIAHLNRSKAQQQYEARHGAGGVNCEDLSRRARQGWYKFKLRQDAAVDAQKDYNCLQANVNTPMEVRLRAAERCQQVHYQLYLERGAWMEKFKHELPRDHWQGHYDQIENARTSAERYSANMQELKVIQRKQTGTLRAARKLEIASAKGKGRPSGRGHRSTEH